MTTNSSQTSNTQRPQKRASYNSPSAPSYVFNVVPVYFDEREIEVGLLSYADHGTLRDLRYQHSTTHVFRRHGAKQIVAIPIVSGAPSVGDEFTTLKLKDQLPLCADLIRNALLRNFHEWGRPSSSYLPLRIPGSAKEDLLRAVLPSGVTCPDWLGVRPQYIIDVRVMAFDKQAPGIYLALNMRISNRVDLNCAQLLERDFFLENSYVGRRVPHPDSRLGTNFRLLGRVDSIDSDTLHLTDARDEETIEASEVYIDARRGAFSEVLRTVFKGRAPQIRAALDQQQNRLQAGQGRLQNLDKVLEKFGRYPMLPNIGFSLGSLLSQETQGFPPILNTPKTTLIFDPRARRTETWNEQGIRRHGPYSSETFTPARPRICVVCRSIDKGRVDNFLSKLLRGLTISGDRQPFENGLIRTYKLEDVDIQFFQCRSDAVRDYQSAAREAMIQGGDRGWDLALIQTDDAYRVRRNAENPYLVTKAFFLSLGIPSQDFRTQTIESDDRELAYICNNIALACYSKMGGVPWLIQSDQSVGHEFVVGLGSANIGHGRLGERERVVGITTVFSGDGLYELSNVSRAVPMDAYQDTLLDSLRKTIERVRDDNNWRPRQYVRLIFHSFKPLRNQEAEAVFALMKELGDYDVDFAFLHLAENHPYLLFNRNEKGAFGMGGQLKGTMAPTRGQFLRLSGDQVLLCLKGAREVKKFGDGLPRPLLLKLHRSSTFKDTTYLARQVFHFSCHSWQTFFPASLPVTISYSQMIARLLGQFAALPNWNPDALYGRIGGKRWFL